MGAPLTNTLARLRSEESAFTLIEVVATTAVMIVVIAATLGVLDATVNQAPRDVERTHVISDAQEALDGLARELRQASDVLAPSTGSASNSLDILVRTRTATGNSGSERRVVYRCDQPSPSEPSRYRACYRWETDPGVEPSGSGQLVLDRIVNGTSVSPVFYPNSAAPTYMRVRLEVPAKGERKSGHAHSVILDDGTQIRNSG